MTEPVVRPTRKRSVFECVCLCNKPATKPEDERQFVCPKCQRPSEIDWPGGKL